jgi:SAM-dependent methyltransferase
MPERRSKAVDFYLQTNREWWNEAAPIHAISAMYDLEGFKAGRKTLKFIEREELGDVSGKSLLHLQCQFGLSSLLLAKLGAKVTGVDFAEQAIALARSLSEELGIEADFVCSDIYDLPSVLSSQFDIVYTSYGVLCYLPDLQRWAKIIAQFLKPRGLFCIVEEHPFVRLFDENATDLQVIHSFYSAEPKAVISDYTYTDSTVKMIHTTIYEWTHSLGEILTALISAGLEIKSLREFPCSLWPCFPNMEKGEDGMWRLKGQKAMIPLLFSLKAIKSMT